MSIKNTETGNIRVYTEKTVENAYPSGLANSVHIAVSVNGEEECPLFENYGILFAKAISGEGEVLETKALVDPQICCLKNGDYLITAVRTKENGAADPKSEGCLLAWTTDDFCSFEELGLLSIGELCDKLGISEGELPSDSYVTVPHSLCQNAEKYWGRVESKAVFLPERVKGKEELEAVRARVVYSDGSEELKRVKWEFDKKEKLPEEGFLVKGKIEKPELKFPLAEGFADPVILLWENNYYYIATNDNLDDIGLYVRKSSELEGLFAEDVKQYCILDRDEEKGLYQTFWAPEFHIINGELCILFAVSGKEWGPQCRIMRLKGGGDILSPEDWDEPVRIRRADGSFLSEDGITLDMTMITSGDKSFYIWSYRRHIGTDLDTGSMIMAAEFNPEEPWKISGEPVLLSRPMYSWENLCGTINNEGPCAFKEKGKIYLTYSAGDACGYLYSVGLLTAQEGADLSKPESWTKSGTPVLNFRSVPKEYGPGHNSFFRDRDGKLWITYHGETSMESRYRCSAMRRIHIGKDNRPLFNLSADEELRDELRDVEIIFEET